MYDSYKKYKKLSTKQEEDIAEEIKSILHAGRDCLRNRDRDTTKISFDVMDVYYGEAFGLFRGLVVLGYGEFGSDNIPHSTYHRWNLKWWFAELRSEVLKEENFSGSNECDYCLKKFGKDGAGRRNSW